MAFPSGLSVPTHLHREGEEVERRKEAAAAQNQPKQLWWAEGTQDRLTERAQDRRTLREWTGRENEMLAGERGRGLREPKLKEQRAKGGRGRRGVGGITPSCISKQVTQTPCRGQEICPSVRQVQGPELIRPSLLLVAIATCMLCFWGPACEGGLGEEHQLPANRNIQIFSVKGLSAEPAPLDLNFRPP